MRDRYYSRDVHAGAFALPEFARRAIDSPALLGNKEHGEAIPLTGVRASYGWFLFNPFLCGAEALQAISALSKVFSVTSRPLLLSCSTRGCGFSCGL